MVSPATALHRSDRTHQLARTLALNKSAKEDNVHGRRRITLRRTGVLEVGDRDRICHHGAIDPEGLPRELLCRLRDSKEVIKLGQLPLLNQSQRSCPKIDERPRWHDVEGSDDAHTARCASGQASIRSGLHGSATCTMSGRRSANTPSTSRPEINCGVPRTFPFARTVRVDPSTRTPGRSVRSVDGAR